MLVREALSIMKTSGRVPNKFLIFRATHLSTMDTCEEPYRTMPRILTIEDDELTAQEIVEELTINGYTVEAVSNGREGMGRAIVGDFDAITLDRMLPEIDGLTIITTLRQLNISTPVIMLSALGDVDDRVRGLKAGGDDYLTKPFNTVELVARIEVLLRRNVQAAPIADLSLQHGPLELDLVKRTVRRNGKKIDLLPTELKVLEYMMRHPGQLITRHMLLEAVWGYRFNPGTNLIEVYMGRLRKKIDLPDSEPLIRTVRGSGYRLG
jgi:two-component system, OmpR family, response regulator